MPETSPKMPAFCRLSIETDKQMGRVAIKLGSASCYGPAGRPEISGGAGIGPG